MRKNPCQSSSVTTTSFETISATEGSSPYLYRPSLHRLHYPLCTSQKALSWKQSNKCCAWGRNKCQKQTPECVVVLDCFNLRSIWRQQGVSDVTTCKRVACLGDLHKVIPKRRDLKEKERTQKHYTQKARLTTLPAESISFKRGRIWKFKFCKSSNQRTGRHIRRGRFFEGEGGGCA